MMTPACRWFDGPNRDDDATQPPGGSLLLDVEWDWVSKGLCTRSGSERELGRHVSHTYTHACVSLFAARPGSERLSSALCSSLLHPHTSTDVRANRGGCLRSVDTAEVDHRTARVNGPPPTTRRQAGRSATFGFNSLRYIIIIIG